MAHIAIPKDKINQFYMQNQIKRLALFGSVLREDFRHDSDIDVIVEFAGLEC
jgi:predicted nucleotidyltransferase